MKKKHNKLAYLLTVVLCVGLLATTAFAYVTGDVNAEAETDEGVSHVTVQSPDESETAEPREEESLAPLTPEGNMTLVDDIQSARTGKQFMTVATKNGNYFYIVIDRDDSGSRTVHFLNQVDESDLLNLLDEDAVAEHQAAMAEHEAPAVEEIVPEPDESAAESQPEPEKKREPSSGVLPGLVVLMLLAGGGGVFAWQRQKKGKNADRERPDPDAYFADDELFLPDEEDSEGQFHSDLEAARTV